MYIVVIGAFRFDGAVLSAMHILLHTSFPLCPLANLNLRSIVRAFLIEEQKIVKAVLKEREAADAAKKAKEDKVCCFRICAALLLVFLLIICVSCERDNDLDVGCVVAFF